MSPPIRNRLVSFRLSEQEYLSLRSYCATQGIRNVSDLARAAVARVVRGGAAGESADGWAAPAELAARTRELNDTMLRLTEALVRLSGLIERRGSR